MTQQNRIQSMSRETLTAFLLDFNYTMDEICERNENQNNCHQCFSCVYDWLGEEYAEQENNND